MTRQTTPSILDDLMRADERIQQLPIDALDDNPYQRRSASVADDDPDLLNLSTDIAQQGIIQHLVVRPHPNSRGRYQIAAGHRRRLAARLAGLEHVPCVVRTLTDDQMLDVVFAENYHRADINPIDRAELMQILASRGLSQQAIADRFAISRPAVSNALRLLRLPSEIQDDVRAGRINTRQADAMLPLTGIDLNTDGMPAWVTTKAIREQALRGDSSDRIRDTVVRAIDLVTRPLPLDTWPHTTPFTGQPGILQPLCTGCPRLVMRDNSQRCTHRPCFEAKSSAWQARQNAELIEATGILMAPETIEWSDYDVLYRSQLDILGLLPPPARPDNPCPNLRLRGRGGSAEYICYHPGKDKCACLSRQKATAKRDGKAIVSRLRTQTIDALTPQLAHLPIHALRLMAWTLGDYNNRPQIHTWDAEQCITLILDGLIKHHTPYAPHERPNTYQAEMEKLLSLAGAASPWTIAAQIQPVDAPYDIPAL